MRISPIAGVMMVMSLISPLTREAMAEDKPAMSGAVTADDYAIGKDDAPVTIIEYNSMTCPHCAVFNNMILPKIKEKYIDPGKVKWVFRDFPLDQLALKAAALARCLPRERYVPFVSSLFLTQDHWMRSKDPLTAIGFTAKLAGLDQAAIDACLANKQIEDAILMQRIEADKVFRIEGTPTLIVNGKKAGTLGSFEDVEALIKPLLSGS